MEVSAESILGVGLAVFGLFSSVTAIILKQAARTNATNNGYMRRSTCTAYRDGDAKSLAQIQHRIEEVSNKIEGVYSKLEKINATLAELSRKG